ncbi:TetR/AcrR family transcriptional regulator [Priestia filamentosa]|uniref:TetR/AcrR family transcriptional regulator n=1 Tax=Priestia filamentosa TaxID=1402861 RepID=UPI0015FF4A57|nr:TetR/AcrR family transcriptional regulator [Priestia filamentosa]
MKEKIIKSALKLFAEKGYHATNVQEIANHAGVAKGTLYSHFASKTGILVAIYGYYLDCLHDSLDQSPPSGPKLFDKRIKHLHKVLHDYLSVALEHEDFLRMQMKEQNINDQHVMEFIQEKRGNIYLEFQQLIQYVGGEKLNHCVLDVAVILNSLIEEYSTVIILDGADISLNDLVDFITQTIICIFKGFENNKISPVLYDNYMKKKQIEESIFYINVIKEKLNSINHIIHNICLPSEIKKEVNSSIRLINDEITKSNPDFIIIKGMLRNIGQVKELKFKVDEIFNIFETSTDI